MREGETIQQPCEAAIDSVAEQKSRGGVTERSKKLTKWGLGSHCQHLIISKEVPKRHFCGEIPQIISSIPQCWGASLKCLYTNAHGMDNVCGELEVWVVLQGYDIVAIMEMQQLHSPNWNVTKEGYRFFSRDKWEVWGGEVALSVREQLECMASMPGDGWWANWDLTVEVWRANCFGWHRRGCLP